MESPVLGVLGGTSAVVISISVSDPRALGWPMEAPAPVLSSGLLGVAAAPMLAVVVERAASVTEDEGEMCALGNKSGF